jgi:hypothetical protein
VRDANHSQILDLGMSAKNLLSLRWIDLLPAADDHIALAVGEIIVAVLVATAMSLTVQYAPRNAPAVFFGNSQ